MAEAGRILFVASPETDFLQDLLFSGLVKRLGHERVMDWPFSPRLYLRRKPYPRTSVRRAQLSLWRRFRGGWSGFSAVVVASCKPRTLRAWQRIMPQMPAGIPVVLLDGGDRTPIGGDLERLGAPGLLAEIEAQRPFDLVLKRETPVGHDFGRPTIPFNFGFNPDFLPRRRLPPCYDVACWCVESHPVRTRALELLAGRFDCTANGSVRGNEGRSYKRRGERYLEELARCRIVISLPGSGWDCLRYWEATAVGACVVSPRAAIEIPDDFVDGEEIVRCADDVSDLVTVCQALLDDEPRRARIAAAGAAKAARCHSDVARADRLLAALAGLGVRI